MCFMNQEESPGTINHFLFFLQPPSVYKVILEKTHQGHMKTSGNTVPATSANVLTHLPQP